MLEVLLRLFTNSLIGAFMASLIFLFLSLAVLLRLLPRILDLLKVVLRWSLILSFRLDYLILAQLASPVRRSLKMEIMKLPARLFACAFLSLSFGFILLMLIQLPIAWWSIGFFLLHGVSISLAWRDFMEPNGLRLGVKK